MRALFACGTLAALLAFHSSVIADNDIAREAALVAQWEEFYQGFAGTSIEAGELCSFAVSVDGKTLAGGGARGELTLWDAELKELRKLQPHKSRILDVRFSPTGEIVATAGEDGEVAVIEVATGKEKARHARHGKEVRALAVTPDGEGVVSGGADGAVGLWKWRSNEWRKIETAKGPVTCLTLTPDGKAVTYGDEEGTLATRSIEKSNDWSLYGFSWSSSAYSQVLYMPSGSHQVTISSWGVSFSEKKGVLGGASFSRGEASLVAIASNGRFALVGSTRGALAVVPLRFRLKPDVGHIFSVHELKSCASLEGLGARVVGLGFSPDGTRAFAADRDGNVVAFGSKQESPPAFSGNEPLPVSRELPPVPHHRHVHSNALAQEWEDYYCGFAPMARSAFELGSVYTVELGLGGGEALVATDKGAYLYDDTLARQVRVFGPEGVRAAGARFVNNSDGVLVAGGDGGLTLYERNLGTLIRAFKQQKTAFTSLAVSPDGAFYATGGDDGQVYVWDPQQAEPLKVLRGEHMRFPGRDEDDDEEKGAPAAITCVAFSPDGQSLRAGNARGSQFGWETRDWRFNSSGWSTDSSPVYVFDETPGGDLEVDARHGLHFRSVTNRLDDTVVRTGFAIQSYRNAPSGRFAVIGGDNGHVYLLPLAFNAYVAPTDHGNGSSGKILSSLDPIARFEGLGGDVRGLSFNLDGSKLAACSTSGKVFIFGSTSPRPELFKDCKPEQVGGDAPRERVPRPRPIPVPGPKPDPAPEAQPRPAEKPPLKTFQPRNFPVLACAISPDGKSFATGHGDRCARLWDYESGDLKQTLAGHAKGVRCIAFSPEGALATGSDDKSIRLWDAASGRCTQTLEGHGSYVSAVAFLPDGRLFSASADGTAAIWNLDTGAQETVLRGHLRGIEDACISADGRFAATASWDGTARVWDLVEGKETLCLRLDNDVPLCVAFTPAAEQLAVGTKNGKLLLYEIRSGQVTRSFHKPTDVRSIYRVAFSPDGKTLFRCGGDDELRSIELETGKAVANDAPQKTFRCLAPAPDNKSFAAGTNDGAACVWQIK